MSSVISEEVNQAYKGMFIGDAAAMPVHWYYSVPKIKEDYGGWINGYENPKEKHPDSCMSHPPLKDENPPQVIGTVIMHGKEQAWKDEGKAVHYHEGLKAGENTLNCCCALRAMKTLRGCNSSMSDDDVIKRILSDFIDFMTTPGNHNDAYCEKWIKYFVIDWVKAGQPSDPDELLKFARERAARIYAEHNSSLSMVGGLVVTTAIVLHFIHRPLEEVMDVAKKFYSLTHPIEDIVAPMNVYIGVLHRVVHGGSLKEEAEKALVKYLGPDGEATLKKFDNILANASENLSGFQQICNELSIACYMKGSVPIALYIGRHFHDDFEGGILTNANVGGDNSNRGVAVGALLGASTAGHGKPIPNKWTDGLLLKSTIDEVLLQ